MAFEEDEYVAACMASATILGGWTTQPLLVAEQTDLREPQQHVVHRVVVRIVIGNDDFAVQAGAGLNAGADGPPQAVALVVGGDDNAGTHRLAPM